MQTPTERALIAREEKKWRLALMACTIHGRTPTLSVEESVDVAIAILDATGTMMNHRWPPQEKAP